MPIAEKTEHLDTGEKIVEIDSNLQRERISPSEKAFAYKMKYDAIKRKTGRRKCGQVDHHSGKKSIEVIGEEGGDSPKQVQRYIKITKLIPELLEKWMMEAWDLHRRFSFLI